MAKRKKGEPFDLYNARCNGKNDLKKVTFPITNDIIFTKEEYATKQKTENLKSSKNLALSFKYLTNNKKYNFNYFKKNTSDYDAFIVRLNSCLIKITSLQVKNLCDPIFGDKFPFATLYNGAYENSSKIFEKTEELISVEFGSKKNERIILFYDGNEITGDNILYVLLFDFNHSAYPH